MIKIQTYNEIDKQQWQLLIEQSPTATWFQTPEAYEFYAANSEEMTPFVYGIEEDEVKGERLEVKGTGNSKADKQTSRLKAVCIGYVTKEKSALKQFLTRRAIIIGGPLLVGDISDEALTALLMAIRQLGDKAKGKKNSKAEPLASTPYTLHSTPIYIETRNFHDYSKWRNVFEQCGFAYQPHLNFHVDTTSEAVAQSNIGKHRWKYIRLSMRDGATMVENPTIEQVKECYDLLKELYTSKVKTPLFSWNFFEQLYHQPNARYLLVELEGKIIGGTVCVCLLDKAMYEWFVCGNDHYRKGIRPSSVATWYGMQYASNHGYPLFDLMGAGKPDEPYGVRDFKAEFGGKLVEHGRFLCVRKPLLYWIGKLGVKLLKRR